MSYKTELQELESELAEIKEKKSRTQRKFFESISDRKTVCKGVLHMEKILIIGKI